MPGSLRQRAHSLTGGSGAETCFPPLTWQSFKAKPPRSNRTLCGNTAATWGSGASRVWLVQQRTTVSNLILINSNSHRYLLLQQD